MRHSIQEARIDVLHNSIDLAKFLVPCDRFKIRQEYDIPRQAFLFIFIGRLIPQKAVDILISAFKKLDSESYLLIVGQGKDREKLEQQVKMNELEKRVVFTGIRNNIPQLLLSSDCFILPSRYEGSPLVLTEALAARVAIIVSDFEAAEEIITPEKNGLVVPRENVESLAQAMIRIRADDVLRARLISEAKKTVERFSISHHVESLLHYINV